VERTYPSVDLALVTGHHGGDVVLQDTDESVLIRDGRDPSRELRVPDLTVLALEL
jgi:hypothetical protein